VIPVDRKVIRLNVLEIACFPPPTLTSNYQGQAGREPVGIAASHVLKSCALPGPALDKLHDTPTKFIVGACMPIRALFASNGLVGEYFVDETVLWHEVAIFPQHLKSEQLLVLRTFCQ